MHETPSRLPSGVLAPLTTPFDRSGEIDVASFRAEIRWLMANGVDGVVIGGSTGEGYALAPDELVPLVDVALDTAAGRIDVVAGIIADSTRAAVAAARQIGGRPIAALQVTPPHYIFPPDDAGMVDFYGTVTTATPRPVIIYNVIPWMQLPAELVARIMQAHPAVIAVKHSRKDIETYRQLVARVGAERVFAAIDHQLGDCYRIGAAGSIAAISAAAPAESAALRRLVRDGDPAAEKVAAYLAALWRVLDGPKLPALVKAAQSAQGTDAGHVRAPMRDATPAERQAIADVLATSPLNSG